MSFSFAEGVQTPRGEAPPKPEKPKIIAIAPPKNLQLTAEVPIIQFVDNTVPEKWLYANSSTKFQEFKLLPDNKLVKESLPDFTDTINLNTFAKEQQDNRSIFYTVVAFEQPQLLRVCYGLTDSNITANMVVAKKPVKHGTLIRVRKGLYPIAIKVNYEEPGQLASLATRFTKVTEQEVEEVYQWRLASWRKTIAMSQENDDKLLASVKFDPTTIRGQEGFFRVGKSINGKWWFIDPEGKAFYHKGSTGLNAGGNGGRRANLPPVSDQTARKWVGYLKSWGFNAMGSWTTPEFFDKNMPFTEIIETFYEEPWLKNKFPDVWDSRWSDHVDAKCKKLCQPLKNNKMLLGYFLDNERGFMEVLKHNERIIANAPIYQAEKTTEKQNSELPEEPILNAEGIGLLQFSLSQPDDVPASLKAWEFVLQRHKSLEGLSKAWQININSQDSLKNLTAERKLLISPAYLKDQHDFVKLWVEQYYQVVRKKIHKYDPNHLLLGTRWGGTPGSAVLEAERKWTDVVSQNNYRANFYERFDELYQEVQLPILNGEINTRSGHFLSIPNPIEPPGGYDRATRRMLREEDALNRIFSHPGVLGYTKYRWHGRRSLFWQNQPNLDVVNPLKWANSRAISIATDWDRPPVKTKAPLNGQIFMTLQSGKVDVEQLTPARKSVRVAQASPDRPSWKLKGRELIIGMVCRQGVWDRKVYGDDIQGTVVDAQNDGELIKLKLKLKDNLNLDTKLQADAEYTLNLTRNDTKLEGTFGGLYNNYSVQGRAIGYLHRPVATVRY
ncbi:hypothetical protein [Hyella patelloides]|uniref:hypothetical protein n=1 Tax=Hyella patelloides TaxID=1982969 RepID=UPI001C9406B2|nr:hypothetical protein [Hyella patelloides]